MGLDKAERAREREIKLGKKRQKRRVGKRVLNEYLRNESYDSIERREKFRR